MALSTGCIDVAPKAREAEAVRDVRVPDGIALETACVPTGVERCFDARDDNCNGVIDEGCGIQTGVLQFAIAWEAAEADVDLLVREPSGEVADLGAPTSGGLVKDRDCPSDGKSSADCQGQNVENVFLSEGEPPRGRYRITVALKKLGDAQAPVKVRLSARVGQRFFGMNLDLSPGAESGERVFEFTL